LCWASLLGSGPRAVVLEREATLLHSARGKSMAKRARKFQKTASLAAAAPPHKTGSDRLAV